MKTKIFFILFFVSGIAKAQYTKLHDFGNGLDGKNPYGSLVSDGTFLYGMALGGGTNSKGSIFKIKPDGTGYIDFFDFAGISNGGYPYGSLIFDGTFLYGMTPGGGTNSMGVIFKIRPDGTADSTLHNFGNNLDGEDPLGNLYFDGTFLYGLTSSGGSNNQGTIFKIMSNGNAYSKLLDFSAAINGSNPGGSFISDGTFLYGMTTTGGPYGDGTIFKIMPDGTGYAKLHDFGSVLDGSSPSGSLISDGTFLYGMTSDGGANGKGIIFKVKPDGTGYTVLLNFSGTLNGSYPTGSLIFDGTHLYGMTRYGGTHSYGTVFEIKPNGTGYFDMFDFDSTNGLDPNGDLISDGIFLYGMTNQGGINNNCPMACGTLFRLGLSTSIEEDHSNIYLNIFPNPSSTIFNINCSEEIKMIIVNDMLGNEIYKSSSDQKTIDASSFPQGVYFITIKTEKGIGVKKIIRE